MRNLLICSTLVLLLFSCEEFNKKKLSSSWATGKPGHVLVVCTDELWTSQNLDTFFTQISPTEEPYYPLEYAFRFAQKNVVGFNSTYKSTRNILIIEKHDNAKYSPAKINILEDKWIKGQVVVEVFFQSIEDLKALSKVELQTITNAFENKENERLLRYYNSKSNKTLKANLKKTYDIELDFPTGVKIINEVDDFMRIDVPDRSREMPMDGGNVQTSAANFIQSSVLLWEKNVPADFEMNLKNLLQFQDTMLKKYAPHEKKGAYLATEYDTVVYPLMRNLEINGLPVIEIKGQYRIGGRSDVFMGGPFISYFFKHPRTQNLVLFFGMVHGPSEPLLNYIREHRALIQTLKI